MSKKGKGQKEESEKEIYSLWWEYLHRSKDFREYCEWWNQRDKKSCPRKFKKGLPEYGGIHPIVWGFKKWELGNFGDPVSLSFDDWWKHRGQDFTFVADIEDYSGQIEQDIDIAIHVLKIQKRRNPTLEEFKETFVGAIKTLPRTLFLKVIISDDKNMEKAFSEFIQHQKRPGGKQWEKDSIRKSLEWERRWVKPTHPIFPKALQRYLKIYDRRFPKGGNKLKIASLAAEVCKKESAISEVIAKVIKIIKHTELGIFPGKY